jgi:hypothetical protein
MKRPVWFFTLVCLLVFLWAMTPVLVPRLAQWFLKSPASSEQGVVPAPKAEGISSPTQDHAISGQFGDMFGTVNSLFAGLALIGVTYGLYLQIELKRREKQPEVFARLAAANDERPLVLAPMDATPGGEVYLTLSVPVYITTGSSAAAFHVAVSSTYGSLAHEAKRLPVPVLPDTDAKNDLVLQLNINAKRLAEAVPAWRGGPGNERSLGQIQLKIEFENQQQAKWQITARYGISTRTPADTELLESWIHNATATSDGARSIELESNAISWTPKEL